MSKTRLLEIEELEALDEMDFLKHRVCTLMDRVSLKHANMICSFAQAFAKTTNEE